jgi:hypothetical protein
LVQSGASRAADTRFAYYETGEPGGLMFEISEALIPPNDAFAMAMESAALNWDGKQLVSALG